MKRDFGGERVTRQLGSCQVKKNPSIREKTGIGQTLTNQPPIHIFFGKTCTKKQLHKTHKKTHTKIRVGA